MANAKREKCPGCDEYFIFSNSEIRVLDLAMEKTPCRYSPVGILQVGILQVGIFQVGILRVGIDRVGIQHGTSG